MFVKAHRCVCSSVYESAYSLMHISPGTLQASRDDEVLEVKAGDLLLQRRLLLHSGGDASGSGPSQAHTTAKTRAKGGEVGLEAGRMEMGREITVKSNALFFIRLQISFILCSNNIILGYISLC